MNCLKCGKEIPGEGMAFCPYCGTRIASAAEKPVSGEAAAWIEKARKVTSLPERKKILEEARKACPEDPSIEWELLFIGTPDPKPKRGTIDFSIIKSWLLQIYRKPGDFSREKRDGMRRELFEGDQLQKVLASSADPEGRMKEYLERLCREYIDIFLKEDNQLMGNLFGFRIGRNRERQLENAVDGMIQLIEADTELTDQQRHMLKAAMIRALEAEK